MSLVEVVLAVVKILIILLFLLNMAPIMTWADRRQSAMVQDRVGPNRAVVWVPGLVARGIVGTPPLLLAAGAALLFTRPVAPYAAYEQLGWVLTLTVLVGWFSLLMLLGHVRRDGASNGLEQALASTTGPTIFYAGMFLHVLALALTNGLPESTAIVAAKFAPLALAGLLVLVGAYASSKVTSDKVGIRLAGTLHAAADAMKMVWKEDFIPPKADRLLHSLAPIISMFPALVTCAVIPFGHNVCFQDVGTKGWDFGDLLHPASVVKASGVCPADFHTVSLQVADLNVGILYLFAMAGTGIVGAAIAGWASDNKFSLLGALRAASQMVSYEVAMGLSLCGLFLIYGSVRMGPMVEWQGANAWGIFVQPLAFFLFLAASGAETKRVPFDAPEGESEIVSGYFVEYSGMKFGMFVTGEYLDLAISSALLVTLFFGGYHLPFVHADGIRVALGDNLFFTYKLTHLSFVVLSMLAFFGKTIFVTFLQIFFRWTLPRFRYDQLMKLGWTKLLPLAIGNLLVTGILVLGFDAAGPGVASTLRAVADVTNALIVLGMVAGTVALAKVLLAPVQRAQFIQSTSTRFAAAAGGVKALPRQA